jgi:hypothetical protein
MGRTTGRGSASAGAGADGPWQPVARGIPLVVRDLILAEIRRLASENGGKPPGKQSFENATGIAQAKWHSVYWARWSDALSEAGFAPNAFQTRRPTADLTEKVADLALALGRLPTRSECRLRRRQDNTFPGHQSISNHFPTQADLIARLRRLSETDPRYADLLTLLPPVEAARESRAAQSVDGSVYLLKSGDHYKIGRSDQLERRIREVRIAQPETVTLVHAIKTDDPAGIEAYWHRRFADRRANGEWFRLTTDDVRAFARRKFQ